MLPHTLVSPSPAHCRRAAAQVESAMGPALQAAFMVMSPIGGKLLLFQSAVPSLGARTPNAQAT